MFASPLGRSLVSLLTLVFVALSFAPPQAAAQAPPAVNQRPPFTDLPAKGAQATGLILIAHGLNSNPAAWPDNQAGNLMNLIDARLTAAGTRQLWDIVPYDWSTFPVGNQEFGAQVIDPEQGRVNAQRIGGFVGRQIFARGYQNVHLIGHSAGAWLIDRAADWLRALQTLAFGFPVGAIQETFLDAYAPRVANDLGDTATFAIQYVDARDGIETPFGPLDAFTNQTLANAYNLDITALDPAQNRTWAGGAHGWPHEWYRQTAAPNPPLALTVGWGFDRSLESGNMPSFGQIVIGPSLERFDVKRGGRDRLIQPDIPARPLPPGQAIALQPPLDFRGGQQSIDGVCIGENGAAGACVLSATGTDLVLDADTTLTEPEAWIRQSFTVTQPTNLLQFDYQFGGDGQGWLAVYVDDRLVFDSDERFARTFLSGPDFESILLQDGLAAGSHSIAFRLDPFSDDPNFGFTSSADVSNVRFGLMTAVSEPSSLTLLFVGICIVLLRIAGLSTTPA